MHTEEDESREEKETHRSKDHGNRVQRLNGRGDPSPDIRSCVRVRDDPVQITGDHERSANENDSGQLPFRGVKT